MSLSYNKTKAKITTFQRRVKLKKKKLLSLSKFKTRNMDFKDLIQTRRSMRKFTDEPISQDDVVALMRAALIAPSSKGLHAWEFILVDDKEMLKKLSKCKDKAGELLEGAALAVVVLGNAAVSDVWIEDASIASIMIQLQAEELGLGSCWVQVRNREREDGVSANDVLHELLNIPPHLQAVSIIALGHKGMTRKPFDESRLLWERVHIGSYKPLEE